MTVVHADTLAHLPTLEAESVDAIVTDPPYGLEFMGKDWDRFRLDDPGTNRHRGERAGQHGEIRPREDGRPSQVGYGGGKRPHTSRCEGCGKRDQFRNPHEPCGAGVWRRELIDPHAAPPTSLAFQEWCRTWALEALRVLKPGGHLLAFGGTRTDHRLKSGIEDAGFEIRDTLAWLYGQGFPKSLDPLYGMSSLPRSTTRAAFRRWHRAVRTSAGGTALKPAHEPIVLARKPLPGTIAQAILEHGTGALNVDGTRITGARGDGVFGGSNAGRDPAEPVRFNSSPGRADFRSQPVALDDGRIARFPANVLLDDEAAALLEQLAGDGIARFFYVAKASTAERNAGLDGDRNGHPTVKPVALMRWLVRLVTPPGGLVLDPFTGSGTTGIAAALEGFRFLGVESDPGYVAIARARIRWWAEHGEAALEQVRRAEQAERSRAELEAAGQLGLFG